MTHPLFRNAAAHADGFRDVDPQLLHAHRGQVRIIDVREHSPPTEPTRIPRREREPFRVRTGSNDP